MKRVIIASIMVAAFAVSVAHGKRLAPKDIPHVTVGNTEYRAPRSHMGCVEAWDKKTDRLIWRRQVYVVRYNTALERDVQDVFVQTMKLKEDALVITNERKSEYLLDLNSLEVKVTKGSIVEENVPKQSAVFKCAACGAEYVKCASCNVPPDRHKIVNHVPVHAGCKGYGHVIKTK